MGAAMGRGHLKYKQCGLQKKNSNLFCWLESGMTAIVLMQRSDILTTYLVQTRCYVNALLTLSVCFLQVNLFCQGNRLLVI